MLISPAWAHGNKGAEAAGGGGVALLIVLAVVAVVLLVYANRKRWRGRVPWSNTQDQ